MPSPGFSIRVYGEVNQQPPYYPDSQGNLSAVSAQFPSNARLAYNFSTADINIYPISDPGAVVGGVSCYSIIEVPPTGLNQFGRKYIVQQTVAQTATLRNA